MKTRTLSIEKGGWPARSVLECGGLTPLSPDAICRVAPKRGYVRALRRLALCFIILDSAFCIRAVAQSYSIDWFKIAGGGGISTNGVYSVSGTTGQPDAGVAMSGGNYSLTGGFWSLIAVAQTVGAPSLFITHSGNAVTVYWQNTGSWTLQQTANLAAGDSWSASSDVTTLNGTNSITINYLAGNLFFRLKQ